MVEAVQGTQEIRLFVACHPAMGHMAQYSVLVREAVARGHLVTWYAPQEWRTFVEDTGAVLFPMSRAATVTNESRDFQAWLADVRAASPAQQEECVSELLSAEVALVDPTVLGVTHLARALAVPAVLVNCIPAFARPEGYAAAFQATVHGFEFPWLQIPCVGPLLPPSPAAPCPAWAKDEDERPLIFVTQGTIATTPHLVRAACVALGKARSFRGLVVCSAKTELEVPDNVIVVPSVDYRLAMSKAALFLTNGGYTGVQYAIAAGVPVISAGTTEDKFRTAELVEWSGIGINLRTDTPSHVQLKRAVAQIITTPRFRERAQEFSLRVRFAAPAARRIVDAIERVFESAPTRPARKESRNVVDSAQQTAV